MLPHIGLALGYSVDDLRNAGWLELAVVLNTP